MLNTLTMTPEQEKIARDQAFYLLKKYTSFTLLDKARELYQGFLDAFAKQLNELPYPPEDQYVKGTEIDYKLFLEYMIPIEEALRLLRKTPHKMEAYKAFDNCTMPIWEHLFGRGAHEVGISYDGFYQKLGLTPEDERSHRPNTGFIQNNLLAACDILNLMSAALWHEVLQDEAILLKAKENDLTAEEKLKETLEEWEKRDKEQDKIWRSSFHTAFNYFSMLSPDFFARPSKYLFPFNFPATLRPCPAHNRKSEGQVWSGSEIQITGIYEPWLLNEKVGCPNYFLAGQTAIEYQLEGSQDKEIARWRLLWEDKRYLDGTVPYDEEDYVSEPAVESADSGRTIISARPGQPVPQTGRWQTPALINPRSIELQVGEKLPSATTDSAGNDVLWFLKV